MDIQKAENVSGLYNELKFLRTLQKDMGVSLHNAKTPYGDFAECALTTIQIPMRWLHKLIEVAGEEIAGIEAEIERL